MTTAYIGLGSNLGEREKSVRNAVKMLAEAEGIEVVRVSEIIETEPLGQANQPKYLNAVAETTTTLSAKDLHKKLVDVEVSLGREQKEKWTSRIIDLDLLLFGTEVINHSDLTIPHPQIHLRSFVLKGLCELNPELMHPVINEPVNELAVRLNGADYVLKPNIPQLVSIAGIIGVGKTTLAEKLAEYLVGKLLLEAYDTNPYMPDVYAGKKQFALDSQLYFLTSRIEQLNPNILAMGEVAVSDYIFDKELIYARRLLDNQQLSLYEKTYPPFAGQVALPVLVIYLWDSAHNCLERIHRRNRPYEQKIELQFLEALDSDYEILFADWKICPVIRVSMSEFDCTKDDDLQDLANQIKCYIAMKNQ
ncbi:MAG: 2-amino-4-hydroxy-6-hydroxymethyldihydropteridine diphosphokinase [Phycisphaerae bacterium]|nr:2-amino-4-hydroxy-6-hydroxymethyldihydropteridine diphosphokinase [Phycisphaerae bacterium]NIW72257.1 2-amino-4-hydroxy-6-hydroxymethyldihydropteridine diphosphokinase [candidate division KSB1 bacterium]NIP56307.1 2-amino-4-hydroxy-6-hydroxymethyldihydropteridine diphosphokinase [Phycisphaerae bacterium]NIS49680.1 2-amino-4-hydroxy-6-hydroxymethyldihydropteridine diphosphokinase [Phycisphaerae bacterium]NIU07411.1 2-amino-4-hydroxy-6-hydroxymethyldihydropteridine diphosphokinase [Phycisphaer